MNDIRLEISGDENFPRVRFIANPLYSLYHYIAKQCRQNEQTDARMIEAVGLMKPARFTQGLHGQWDEWENPIASADTVQQVATGLAQSMASNAEKISRSMELAQDYFMSSVWNERQPYLDEALNTVQNRFANVFGQMVQRQSQLLELSFPRHIDVHLVVDCYEHTGAYSHPTTVDVTHYRGLELCEGILHEITHVADVETSELSMRSLKDEIIESFMEQDVDYRTAWNIWHAVIFAASADQIRRYIFDQHIDYATRRRLYSLFKVPHVSNLFVKFSRSSISKREFIDHLVAQLELS